MNARAAKTRITKNGRPKEKEITPRQAEALAWIVDVTGEKGYPPSQAELAKGLGISTPTAQDLINQLRAARVIKTVPGISRSIVVDKTRAAAVLFLHTVRRILAGDKRAAGPEIQEAVTATYQQWLNEVA